MLYRSYKSKRFLVVDDFDNFIISMRQMLRKMGATEIDSARSGDEAVAQCSSRHYDVVFCDYNMGDSTKSGQQVLEELRFRKLLRHTDLFVMISAEAAKDMVYGALEYQPDGYIAKPVTQTLLKNRLDRLIQRKVQTMDIEKAMDEEDWPGAIKLAQQQMKIDPENRGWLIRTLARLCHLHGDYRGARKVCSEVLSKRPVDWARMGMGKAWFMEGQYDEATAAFESLLADNQQYVEAWDWLARCHRARNEPEKARDALVKATEISPRAILRQQELASVSRDLNDLQTASQALKMSSRLAEKSVYETPDIHLEYARTLVELAEENSGTQAARQAHEAVAITERTRRKFSNSDEVALQSRMVEARALKESKNEAGAKKAMAEARKLYEKCGAEQVQPGLALEMAQTLFNLGDTDEAESLLQKYAEAHPEDARIHAQVEEMLEEPVSQSRRHKAREFNREAVALYEKGELAGALEKFDRALEITPRQTGLNLNYLQVLLKAIGEGGAPGDAVPRAASALERLQGITSEHRQFRRYEQLKNRFEAMQNAG